MKKIGEVIANVRTEKGWSQIQLAERMGIDRTVLSKWERDVNNIPYHQLALLAECLETPIIFSERGIFAGKEAIQMSQIYSTSFTNFSVSVLKADFNYQANQFKNDLTESTIKAIEKLENEGFMVKLPYSLRQDLTLSGANQQEVGEEVVIHLPNRSLGSPCLKIINTGSLHIHYVDLHALIQDLTDSYGEEVASIAEKGLLYSCVREGMGRRLFDWFENNQTEDVLIHLCPYVQDVASQIVEQCQKNNYVKTLEDSDYAFTQTEAWHWIWNLGLYDLYQDHEWRVFWDIDGEERLVEDMDVCHYLGQALEVIESIVETDLEDLLEEFEIEED